jgi:outer membrane lipoprotein SlyB
MNALIKSPIVRLLMACLLMLGLSNCSSSPKVFSTKTGKVIHWHLERGSGETSVAGPLFGAAHGAILGSAIGNGTAANVAGAITVGLLEALLIHKIEKDDANYVRSTLHVRIEGGGPDLLLHSQKSRTNWRVGERVYVTFEKKGRPIEAMKASEIDQLLR